MGYYFKVVRLRFLPFVLTVVLAATSLLALHHWAEERATADALSPLLFQRAIVVDPGHGGYDPGVIGTGSGTREKDICLAISQKLSELLRAGGAVVTLTREQDQALADQKSGDLAERVRLADELNPAAFLSIHGNSFPSAPSSHGAQVFYYGKNAEGKLLAEAIQQTLVGQLANTERVALEHKSAYILKHISVPAVVVEVGFLSNATEEAALNDEDYQWQVAWAIYEGLIDYLAGAESVEEPAEITE